MVNYKGTFTTDINDIYWNCYPVYYGKEYFKAKLFYFHKKHDYFIDREKVKIYYKNIEHWYKYKPLESN